ncbi:hypothetical protein GUITHDRAFT_118464 [Guillardia theta CCMP2712]|uniref:RWP-RK domain-containing protein n=1 Tax=Guillardia theta (strain CCMP2712) TaxID=905079 RepID=L1IHF7_GUITC|nr:hypothetical protein GUITHDRAFT_118464 [Guillardia theta CCMP2712]EKX35339.1 hypothetical protein GUITHDRAFT_118464 [Guillardia theta CCMP2712]|eukprot:XP_005822319.1 hypothetical protein GUITHDRAFT_118464 [Guillardia theta CCMP2712]
MTSFPLFSCGSCEFASFPLEVHAPQDLPDEACWESLPQLDEFESSQVDPFLELVDQESLPPLYEDDWFMQAFPGDNFSSAVSDTTSVSASPAEPLSPALEEETSACSESAHPAQKESSCKTVLINARKGGENNNGQLVRITIEDLQKHFHESMETAASHLGIGRSTMKHVCRRLGVPKWPYTNKGKKRRTNNASYVDRSFLSSYRVNMCYNAY